MDARETTIFNAILISAVIIGLIIVYFIISLIRHQRRNLALYKAKVEAEITTLENERKRIAADLHDELGPVLSSAKFKINSVEVKTNEDHGLINQVSDHIDNIIRRMREISNDLVPNTLIRKGAVHAIDEFVNIVSKTNGLNISFAHRDIPELTQSKGIHIFRIIQEIVHNTVKHANAEKLKIEMSVKPDKIILMTQDDGVGFDYLAASAAHSGLGLRNLLSRTELLGGEIYVNSKRGKGTEYTIEIPI